MFKIMKKIYVKSKFKAVLLKLTANVQSDNSFVRCLKFTPFELSAPAPNVQKWILASHFFIVWSSMMPMLWGNIHVQNHEKIYVKSEFKAVLLKLTANVQSDNSLL